MRQNGAGLGEKGGLARWGTWACMCVCRSRACGTHRLPWHAECLGRHRGALLLPRLPQERGLGAHSHSRGTVGPGRDDSLPLPCPTLHPRGAVPAGHVGRLPHPARCPHPTTCARAHAPHGRCSPVAGGCTSTSTSTSTSTTNTTTQGAQGPSLQGAAGRGPGAPKVQAPKAPQGGGHTARGRPTRHHTGPGYRGGRGPGTGPPATAQDNRGGPRGAGGGRGGGPGRLGHLVGRCGGLHTHHRLVQGAAPRTPRHPAASGRPNPGGVAAAGGLLVHLVNTGQALAHP